MKKFVYGVKIGMTSLFTDSGDVRGVTVVQVLDTKAFKNAHINDSDFTGILVGASPFKEKNLNAPVKGFFNKLGSEPLKLLKGVQLEDLTFTDDIHSLDISQFEIGEKLNVKSKSKGRGFAGTIVRHNFRRGNKTHGSKSYRAPGSIGGGTYPGRVIKGKKMAGQYGNTYTTIKNLEILKIDTDKNLLFIKGAIPGKSNAIIELTS